MSPHEATSLLNRQDSSHSRQLHEDVPFYAPPRQRQRWDDTQVLPHVNWGDLYWDLFYVSGAYNLAAALKESLTTPGFFYFVTCYVSIYSIWFEKVHYDAKYAPDDNLFHRGLELFHILVLATVVQHIRPLSVMQNSQEETATMVFCSALTLESLLVLYRQIDVYWNVDGGPEAKHNAVSNIRLKSAGFLLYLAASIVAGVDHFGQLPGDDPSDKEDSEATSTPVNHLPMILCLAGYLSGNIVSLIDRFLFTAKREGSYQDYFVPLNLEFTLHRIGEWVMLMLGESVLALLVVQESAGQRYYITFFSGIITVTLFQYLFFRSQPIDADDHALRRSSAGGYFFIYSMTAYSASLILVGCSYKMILHYYLEEQELMEEIDGSLLAAEALHEELEQPRREIGKLFSWAMALSFFTLDFMTVSHRGWAANLSRFCVNGKLQGAPICILIITYILLAVTVTMHTWFDRLEALATMGMVTVILQVLLRTRGLRYFPVSKKGMEFATCGNSDPAGFVDQHRWPNRTEPQTSVAT